jgi:DNA-binding FadR family transcriptional regulator
MSELAGEVHRVAEVVLCRILDGTYPSGLRLPTEAALAAELDCGRSTVREALRHLADQGLLQSRRGSGAHVLDWRREGSPALLPEYVRLGQLDVPPGALVATMLRIRRMMASEAVRLASEHGSPETLAEAETLLAAAPSLVDDPAAHATHELEIYRALVRASRMWPAVWVVNSLWTPMSELNRMFAPAIGSVPKRFQPTMERLLELIGERRTRAALAHLEAWFDDVDGALVRKLEGWLAPVAPPPNEGTTRSRRTAPRKAPKAPRRVRA